MEPPDATTPFQGPVYVTLRASACAPRIVVAVHVVAAVVLLVHWPAGGALFAVLVAVALSGLHAAHSARGDAPHAPAALLLGTGDTWRVRLRSGAVLEARLVGEPFVTASLTVLALALDGGRARRVVLHADNCTADAFRRLRVRLRHPPGAA